jgi:hypothetical protein
MIGIHIAWIDGHEANRLEPVPLPMWEPRALPL